MLRLRFPRANAAEVRTPHASRDTTAAIRDHQYVPVRGDTTAAIRLTQSSQPLEGVKPPRFGGSDAHTAPGVPQMALMQKVIDTYLFERRVQSSKEQHKTKVSMLQELFESFDCDGSGGIDQEEFRVGMQVGTTHAAAGQWPRVLSDST